MSSESYASEFGITKEFIAEIIHEGIYKDAQVVDFQVTSGSSIGDNFTTVMLAVQAEIQRKKTKETVHLMIKKFPSSPMRQRIHEQQNLFGKEVPFYNTILPDIQNKYKSLGLKDSLQLAIPTYYHGSSDGFKSYMAMENMKLKGYKMVAREEGLSLDHITLVLKEYGKFHASSQLLKQDGSVKERYHDYLKEIFSTDGDEIIKNILEHGLERSVKVVEQHSSRAADIGRLTKFLGKSLEELESLLNDVREPYATLGHGDSWFNNMMFTYKKTQDNKEVPVSAMLLDWQLIRYGSPCFDLSYTLFTSVDASIRKEHLLSLLKVYHQSFTDTLVTIGVDHTPFTIESFWEEWVRYRRYGFLLGMMLVIMFRSSSEHVVDFDAVDADALDDVAELGKSLGSHDDNISQKCIDELVALFEEGLRDEII